MRKLQLIRPWRLEAVRQKAAYSRQPFTEEMSEIVSCRGPQGVMEETAVRGALITAQRATLAAPVSNIIFATGTNPRW